MKATMENSSFFLLRNKFSFVFMYFMFQENSLLINEKCIENGIVYALGI
jgi:hypothetical protein